LIAFGACSGELLQSIEDCQSGDLLVWQSLSDCTTWMLIAFGACSGELLQSIEDCKSGDLLVWQSLSDCKTWMLIAFSACSGELLQSMEDCQSVGFIGLTIFIRLYNLNVDCFWRLLWWTLTIYRRLSKWWFIGLTIFVRL
jgi:hypothetical protein